MIFGIRLMRTLRAKTISVLKIYLKRVILSGNTEYSNYIFTKTSLVILKFLLLCRMFQVPHEADKMLTMDRLK